MVLAWVLTESAGDVEYVQRAKHLGWKWNIQGVKWWT